jgi:hypothetical protein
LLINICYFAKISFRFILVLQKQLVNTSVRSASRTNRGKVPPISLLGAPTRMNDELLMGSTLPLCQAPLKHWKQLSANHLISRRLFRRERNMVNGCRPRNTIKKSSGERLKKLRERVSLIAAHIRQRLCNKFGQSWFDKFGSLGRINLACTPRI